MCNAYVLQCLSYILMIGENLFLLKKICSCRCRCRYCFGGAAVVEFARLWPNTPGLQGELAFVPTPKAV